MNKLKLKWRILLPIIITITISISSSVILTAVNSSQIATDMALESMRNMAFRKANYARSEFEQSIGSLRTLNNILAVFADGENDSATTREEVIEMLSNILLHTPSMFANYVYFKPDGFDRNDDAYKNTPLSDSEGRFNVYITRDDSAGGVYAEYLPFLYEEPEFAAALNASGEIWIDPLVFKAWDGTEYYMCSFLIPIIVQGKTVGVVGSDILFDTIQENFVNEKIFKDSDIFMVSAGGDIPVHPNPNLRGKNISGTFTAEVENLMKGVMNSSSEGGTVQVYSQVKKTEALYVAAPFTVGDTGAYWAVGIFVPVKEILADVNRLILLTVIFGITAVGIILAVSYVIVNKSSREVSQINDKIDEYSHQLALLANDISASGEAVAQGSMEQAASIEQTSATMNETASMIEYNNRSTQQALLLTRTAAEAASKGFEEVSALTQFMNELSVSSHSISNVIKAIEDIAFQTTILSLNASVESARAGEAGKAFIVVADEVRRLSARCNEEVQNTTDIIEKNIILSRQGIENSQYINATLMNILNSITKLESLVNEISQASDEQSKGVGQINIAVSQLEKTTQQSAASAEENSASSTEMKNLSEKLEEAARVLNAVIYGEKGVGQDRQS